MHEGQAGQGPSHQQGHRRCESDPRTPVHGTGARRRRCRRLDRFHELTGHHLGQVAKRIEFSQRQKVADLSRGSLAIDEGQDVPLLRRDR